MIPTSILPNVTYDIIEVEGNIAPAIQWCITTFGPPGQRWFMGNNSFYFLKSRDATLFELRWCQ